MFGLNKNILHNFVESPIHQVHEIKPEVNIRIKYEIIINSSCTINMRLNLTSITD